VGDNLLRHIDCFQGNKFVHTGRLVHVNLQAIWGLLKETFSEWSEDKASRLAAALSYYTIFSLAPLLVIVIAIAGLVFGEAAVEGQLVGQIQGLVGEQGASLIQTMIANASRSGSGPAALLGFAMLLFGAAGVFGQLQDSLNTIWDVRPKPGRGILGMVKDRLGAFAMVVGTGFLLLVSLVVSAALSAVGEFAGDVLPLPAWALQLFNLVISFAVITVVFALIYKVIPDAEIAWRDVWIGAALTSFLFSIGKYAIGLYLGQSSASSVFGAAGSLVVVLLWIYYSALILFFGAEFTQVYARRYGSGIVPSSEAIPLSDTARA
jgi:membrane protein